MITPLIKLLHQLLDLAGNGSAVEKVLLLIDMVLIRVDNWAEEVPLSKLRDFFSATRRFFARCTQSTKDAFDKAVNYVVSKLIRLPRNLLFAPIRALRRFVRLFTNDYDQAFVSFMEAADLGLDLALLVQEDFRSALLKFARRAITRQTALIVVCQSVPVLQGLVPLVPRFPRLSTLAGGYLVHALLAVPREFIHRSSLVWTLITTSVRLRFTPAKSATALGLRAQYLSTRKNLMQTPEIPSAIRSSFLSLRLHFFFLSHALDLFRGTHHAGSPNSATPQLKRFLAPTALMKDITTPSAPAAAHPANPAFATSGFFRMPNTIVLSLISVLTLISASFAAGASPLWALMYAAVGLLEVAIPESSML